MTNHHLTSSRRVMTESPNRRRANNSIRHSRKPNNPFKEKETASPARFPSIAHHFFLHSSLRLFRRSFSRRHVRRKDQGSEAHRRQRRRRFLQVLLPLLHFQQEPSPQLRRQLHPRRAGRSRLVLLFSSQIPRSCFSSFLVPRPFRDCGRLCAAGNGRMIIVRGLDLCAIPSCLFYPAPCTRSFPASDATRS